MLPTGTFLSPVSASSDVEVRDHHQKDRLGMPVNLVYNMSMWVNGKSIHLNFDKVPPGQFKTFPSGGKKLHCALLVSPVKIYCQPFSAARYVYRSL